MRIIQRTERPDPSPRTAARPAPAPDTASARGNIPEAVSGRVEALEKFAKSSLQSMQALEARVQAVEKERSVKTAAKETDSSTPEASRPAAAAAPTRASVDPDQLKKGLLTKMWKHLNDKRPPKIA